jgi:pyruvate/2-oxoglutarate dehydrogenase complex dihydrolipoamide dehydrogenase (E3) component
MTVAIIERKLFAGTCLNTGCIPTKTMVASAYVAHMVRRAADFGVVESGPAGVDMKLIKSRKDAVSGPSRSGVEGWLEGMKDCTVYQGHARFESAKQVSVGSERLVADHVFVNVGGRAVVPQMSGIEDVPYLTNSSIMDIDYLPPHL